LEDPEKPFYILPACFLLLCKRGTFFITWAVNALHKETPLGINSIRK
jgi:hypothetical protein